MSELERLKAERAELLQAARWALEVLSCEKLYGDTYIALKAAIRRAEESDREAQEELQRPRCHGNCGDADCEDAERQWAAQSAARGEGSDGEAK